LSAAVTAPPSSPDRGSIFSAGVDLLRLCDGGPGYLQEFLPALSEAFLALFSCPVPVVAAVNGHAIAGGCVLVCACDHRVMNAGHGRIGVTELLAGLPFPVTALEILRFAVGTHRLQELTHLGRTYPADQAVGLGLIDEAVAGASVLARAVAIAGQFAALAPEPLAHTRRQIRAPRWTASGKNAPPTSWCAGCGTRRRLAKRSRSTCGRRCGTDMPRPGAPGTTQANVLQPAHPPGPARSVATQ
jgi:enoyl-CoA hydratase/carnithine racemase